MKNLYILDAVSFLFRSYFAIGQMTNQRGESTNALYGFIRSVQKIIKDFSPGNLVAVFDGPDNKRSRVKIYEEYKSNRTGMPEDLFPQLALAHNYCSYAGIPYLVEEGVEADDLIGVIAKWAEKKGMEVFICSSDKDLCQLITDRIFMLNTHKGNLLIDREKVEELHGVKPEQIVDYLAIMGDKSDNIPGIPGFGPKTAAALLQEYGSLNNILLNLDEMKNQKRAEKIRTHKADALMSQQLAQLIVDVPYPEEELFYQIKSPDLEKLGALYRDMNFNTLLRELSEMGSTAPEEERPPIDAEEVDYQLIDDLEGLWELIKTLQEAPSVCIDTETHTLEPMRARLVGVGFCIEPRKAWYIPMNGKLGLDAALKELKPLIENPAIAFYGHNIKYDIHILRNHGIKLKNIGFDTMIASYLLNPQKNRHGLDELTLEKFHHQKIAIKDLIGTGKKQKSLSDLPIEEVGNYCSEDVDYTCRLKELFEKELERGALAKIFYEIELPLIPVLVDMERFGMYLDGEQLHSMSGMLREKLKIIEREIYDLAGEEFNIKSPKQLAAILFDKMEISLKGKKKSTRADILEGLKKEHPIAGKILTFRGLEKLRSTYVDTLPLQVYEDTGRIHCTFMQTIAATGRLSCKDPNLQNIPIRSEEGRKIREAFKPDREDWCYLSADYSQIELRLLAHMSNDPKLLAAFQNNEDIHASTAASVFDLPLDQVTREMRAQAKAVNFGILYGQQAFGLSEGLGIDIRDAALFIKKYFERYPDVKAFIEACKERVRESGVATTLFGRERPIPEINSPNGMIRAAAERLAVNTPLQGSQADIIKKAMIKIHETLNKEAHMVLQIHDELIFELPRAHVEETERRVREIMENIVSLSIPLTVNIAIGKNWGEC
ncbi:MAG: DNA polymerase I [Chlamydiae bacterium]|nr:DNA polymerase I [Chlamydiota bacterium]